MKKRNILCGVSVAMVAAGLALTGCSGGGDSVDGGNTTIRFWSWNPDATTVEPYIEAFEAEHPDITVEHRFIQYSDYVNTTQLALQSDSGPDVFGVQVGALTNQFEPLALDLAPYMEESLGADWRDQMMATDQLAVGDKQVAMPWMITGGGMIWANETLINELGLEVPSTLDELKSFCATVNGSGKTCMVQGAKDAWQNIDVYQSIINQLAPGEFCKAMNGESSFTQAEFVEAFEIWKGLFDDGVFQEGALGTTAYPDANDSFAKGEAALIAFGTWANDKATTGGKERDQETYGKEFDEDALFVPHFFPAVKDGAKTGRLFGGPDVGFSVSAQSKNPDAAVEFVRWLTASEAGQKIIATTVQQPALTSVPLDLSTVQTDRQKEALEAEEPALADMIGPREIDDADVKTALGDALSAVASGQQSPQDAAKAVDNAIKTAE